MPGVDITIPTLASTLAKLEKLAVATGDLRELHERIGIKILQWVWQNFDVGGLEQSWSPLRPNTVYGRRMRGGGAKPLQDTGKMRASFSFKATTESVAVGSPDIHALFAHGGTAAHPIEPVRRKALAFPSVWGFKQAKAAAQGGPIGAWARRIPSGVVESRWITPKGAAKMGKGRFMKQATTFQATGRGKKDFASLNFMVVRHVDHPGTPPRPLLPSASLAQQIAKQVAAEYLQEVLHG